MSDKQPEALRLAEIVETRSLKIDEAEEIGEMLRQLYASVQELE